jgi:hypothetical protein
MLASRAVATAELTRSAHGSGAPAGPGDRVDQPSRAASALSWALLLALLYAAFAHGVAQYPDETRLQIGLCAVSAFALAGVLLGPLRPRAPALAWVGVGVLVLFAAWSGITLAWSVAPDRTWLEVNRAIAYVLVLVLAMGASHPRAMARVAVGYSDAPLLSASAIAERAGLLDRSRKELLDAIGREPSRHGGVGRAGAARPRARRRRRPEQGGGPGPGARSAGHRGAVARRAGGAGADAAERVGDGHGHAAARPSALIRAIRGCGSSR